MNIINNALLCRAQKLSSGRSWLVCEPFWGLHPSVTMEYDVSDVSSAWWDSRMHIQPNTSSKNGSDRKVYFSVRTKAQTAKENLCFQKKNPQVRAGEELNPLPRVVVLTTSVLVILASSSVRLSRLSLWSVWSSCRPQMAAPMLPLAIMEGGFMASRSSARDKSINVQSVKQQQQQL